MWMRAKLAFRLLSPNLLYTLCLEIATFLISISAQDSCQANITPWRLAASARYRSQSYWVLGHIPLVSDLIIKCSETFAPDRKLHIVAHSQFLTLCFGFSAFPHYEYFSFQKCVSLTSLCHKSSFFNSNKSLWPKVSEELIQMITPYILVLFLLLKVY